MSFPRTIAKCAPACCAAFFIANATASAADRRDDFAFYPRLVGEVLFGTSGFEPGVAAEWRADMGGPMTMIRPEVLLNEDGRPGGAISLNAELDMLSLPDHQTLSFGPRVAYHNSDDSGWEGALLAIYNINIAPAHADRHYIEIIGAAGIVEDKRDGEDHSARFAGTVGLAYGFQF